MRRTPTWLDILLLIALTLTIPVAIGFWARCLVRLFCFGYGC